MFHRSTSNRARAGLPMLSLLTALMWAGAAAPCRAAAASDASVAAHVAAAGAAAGSDLQSLMGLCKPAPARRPSQADADKGIAAQLARPAPAPGQAFDNLYFVGGAWASAWALRTSDGIILIDALNNASEAASLIGPGLRRFGLDPATIKTVIITHGHGDHYGGADWLTAQFKPKLVMSETDWRMTETRLEFATPLWGAPPRRDVAVVDGDSVTLGDTVVKLYVTPGHTLGTLTPVFEVREGGRNHRVALWGGTAFNFGNDVPRMNAYIAATERMGQIVRDQDIDVLLSNHSAYDDTVPKLEALRNQATAQPHPFVNGNAAVQRAMTVMGECAQAQRDRYLMMP